MLTLEMVARIKTGACELGIIQDITSNKGAHIVGLWKTYFAVKHHASSSIHIVHAASLLAAAANAECNKGSGGQMSGTVWHRYGHEPVWSISAQSILAYERVGLCRIGPRAGAQLMHGLKVYRAVSCRPESIWPNGPVAVIWPESIWPDESVTR